MLATIQVADIFLNLELFTRTIEEGITSYYEENPAEFVVDGGDIDLREEEVFMKVFSVYAADLSGLDTDDLADFVWERLNTDVFEKARKEISEQLKEERFYEQNPLRYHGLSIWDFC